MTKKEQQYTFRKKRNYKLITPCCNRSNKDGKFTNYNELPDNYGYCHSCGKTTIPPTIYLDNIGNEYIWNDTLCTYERNTLTTNQQQLPTIVATNVETKPNLRFIPESVIWESYLYKPENNLLKYLRKTYSKEKVELVKKWYVIGTSNNGGAIFWNINKNNEVQKDKICSYDTYGKRYKNSYSIKSVYKSSDGYKSCLFGEHLLIDKHKKTDKVILVESEKTAITGYLNLGGDEYTWLAYGGKNGLTNEKLKPLIGYNVLIIPDISNEAVDVMNNKLSKMIDLGINAKIWDMTNGKSDNELKKQGIYNDDLEDCFRKIKNSLNQND